jgi:hypothetical protein
MAAFAGRSELLDRVVRRIRGPRGLYHPQRSLLGSCANFSPSPRESAPIPEPSSMHCALITCVCPLLKKSEWRGTGTKRFGRGTLSSPIRAGAGEVQHSISLERRDLTTQAFGVLRTRPKSLRVPAGWSFFPMLPPLSCSFPHHFCRRSHQVPRPSSCVGRTWRQSITLPLLQSLGRTYRYMGPSQGSSRIEGDATRPQRHCTN